MNIIRINQFSFFFSYGKSTFGNMSVEHKFGDGCIFSIPLDQATLTSYLTNYRTVQLDLQLPLCHACKVTMPVSVGSS